MMHRMRLVVGSVAAAALVAGIALHVRSASALEETVGGGGPDVVYTTLDARRAVASAEYEKTLTAFQEAQAASSAAADELWKEVEAQQAVLEILDKTRAFADQYATSRADALPAPVAAVYRDYQSGAIASDVCLAKLSQLSDRPTRDMMLSLMPAATKP